MDQGQMTGKWGTGKFRQQKQEILAADQHSGAFGRNQKAEGTTKYTKVTKKGEGSGHGRAYSCRSTSADET